MKKLAIIAVTVALMAIGRSTQAQLTEYYVAQQGGSPDPSGPVLQVISTVTGSYNYNYAFTLGYGTGAAFTPEDTANAILLFSVTLLDTTGVSNISGGGGLVGNTIIWTFPFVYTGDVSYTSPNPPGTFDATAQDVSVNWTGGVLVPAAVPEASTIMAGALMILPLGIGAFRVLRKERMA